MTTPTFDQPAQTWDKRFGGAEFLFGTEPNVYLASQKSLLQAGGKALAVADGEGRNSVWLAEQGVSVDAFDIPAVGVAKARQLAQLRGVTVNFNVSDAQSWDWQTSTYDTVIAIFIQFADPILRQHMFAHMISALKPGGFLILQGYSERQLEFNTGGPGVLSHLYTEALLRSALRRSISSICRSTTPYSLRESSTAVPRHWSAWLLESRDDVDSDFLWRPT